MKRIEKSDKAFSLMDRSRDNSISVDEFIKVTKNFGHRNVVCSFSSQININRNNSIIVGEFISR